MEKFSLNNAYSIAKVMIACGVVEEDALMNVVHDLMDGTFNLGVQNEKSKKSKSKGKKDCKEKVLVS